MKNVKRVVRKGHRKEKILQQRRREVAQMLASGRYSSVEMAKNGLGWVAIEKSPQRHKPEEIEAAYYMAKAGFNVVLINEAGNDCIADGFIFSFVFEQKTPQAKSQRGIVRALVHAKTKELKGRKVDVVVIYDKFNNYNQKEVNEGIALFEKINPEIRYKGIIFITKTGRVIVHHHTLV